MPPGLYMHIGVPAHKHVAYTMLAPFSTSQLILYELHGSELREAGERVLPDTALGLDWLGPELLALATRAKYALINVVTGGWDVGSSGVGRNKLCCVSRYNATHWEARLGEWRMVERKGGAPLCARYPALLACSRLTRFDCTRMRCSLFR